MSAVDLAVAAGRATLEPVGPDAIDQVILGNILSAGLGMNIARQVGVALGIPIDRIAYSVNMMCASGMHAVVLAAQAVGAGEARAVLCGGTESMSNAPYLLPRARTGYKLGDGVLVDAILRDGLVDSFSNEHMGLTAERLASEYAISRAEQDAFALRSQQRWTAAHAAGAFDAELVKLPKLDHDEHPRPDATTAQLASLRPAFREDGTVTAGNASGINDGAAILVLCDGETAAANGWKPLAMISGWAEAGCDPAMMGLGPVHAVRKLRDKSACRVTDFDVVEINEAFAAQVLACIRELDLDTERVNPCGGAIAVGHPIGASGARLVAHLAHRIARGEARRAMATVCVGGGMGAVVTLETP
jgi:acetyl-CoA C-acetyltransferase